MITVEEVADWVEKDLSLLPDYQAVEGRKLLVAPHLIELDYDSGKGNGIIVARKGDRVTYFDDLNDEFAVGNVCGSAVELLGLYGDFRYAIQALIKEE